MLTYGKNFKVAGFSFSLVMDDAHPLWGWLSNYEPFELKTTPEETLADLLTGNYEVSRETALEDSRKLIAAWEEAKVLE